MKMVVDVQALLPEHVALDSKQVLELIKEFAGTWVSLDAYDNKRSGTFAFVRFLRKSKIKGARNINSASLTPLTLLMAESDPARKGQMTALITQTLV